VFLAPRFPLLLWASWQRWPSTGLPFRSAALSAFLVPSPGFAFALLVVLGWLSASLGLGLWSC